MMREYENDEISASTTSSRSFVFWEIALLNEKGHYRFISRDLTMQVIQWSWIEGGNVMNNELEAGRTENSIMEAKCLSKFR